MTYLCLESLCVQDTADILTLTTLLRLRAVCARDPELTAFTELLLAPAPMRLHWALGIQQNNSVTSIQFVFAHFIKEMNMCQVKILYLVIRHCFNVYVPKLYFQSHFLMSKIIYIFIFFLLKNTIIGSFWLKELFLTIPFKALFN